jgi:hypothetical protein
MFKPATKSNKLRSPTILFFWGGMKVQLGKKIIAYIKGGNQSMQRNMSPSSEPLCKRAHPWSTMCTSASQTVFGNFSNFQPKVGVRRHVTILLFNIARENHHFVWVNHLFLWAIYTMAMSNNQRVNHYIWANKRTSHEAEIRFEKVPSGKRLQKTMENHHL